VHDEMRIRNPAMYLLDAIDREDVASGRPGELVRSVGSANGDRKRIDSRPCYEIDRLLGIREELRRIEATFSTGTVFLACEAGLQ
jgi:hypothetical protein